MNNYEGTIKKLNSEIIRLTALIDSLRLYEHIIYDLLNKKDYKVLDANRNEFYLNKWVESMIRERRNR